MNHPSTISLNENCSYQKPLKYKNISRISMDKNNKNAHNTAISVLDKIKSMFSSKPSKPIENMNNAKLKMNANAHEQKKTNQSLIDLAYIGDDNSEWQKVYRDTCKIKLPVSVNNTKLSLTQEIVDDWTQDQKKFSNELNKMVNNKHSDEKITPNNYFLSEQLSPSSYINNNEKKPSKFKYYYNYYLVDEYLESLAESQHKKLDATGLDDEGQLYDNVSLNVKPIIISKHRLENGVPYDPDKLLN